MLWFGLRDKTKQLERELEREQSAKWNLRKRLDALEEYLKVYYVPEGTKSAEYKDRPW